MIWTAMWNKVITNSHRLSRFDSEYLYLVFWRYLAKDATAIFRSGVIAGNIPNTGIHSILYIDSILQHYTKRNAHIFKLCTRDVNEPT